MPTPSPKVMDASTPAQKDVQQQALNPFFIHMIQGGPANNPFTQYLNQTNYEGKAFDATEAGLLQIFNQGQGQGQEFVDAYQPTWQNNLQFALGSLGAAAPMASSSAFATQGIGATNQAMDAFNLFALNAKQNLLTQALQAAGQYGTLAQGAGNAVAMRALAPFLQTMQTAAQYANPRSEVYQPPGFMDYFSQGAQALAALSSAAKPGGW